MRLNQSQDFYMIYMKLFPFDTIKSRSDVIPLHAFKLSYIIKE